MQFETEGGAMETTVISRISPGRKNRLCLEVGAYASIRHREPVDGFPVSADRLRAARITEAVLESAAQGRWVDVPAREPMEVAP